MEGVWVMLVVACLSLAGPVAWVAVRLAPKQGRQAAVRPPVGEMMLVGAGLMVMFGVATWRLAGYGPVTVVAHLWLFSGLMALSVADVRTLRLPNRLVLGTAAGVVVFVAVQSWVTGDAGPAVDALVGGAVCGGVLLVAHLVSPAAVGFGDVKLAVLVGMDVGWVLGRGDVATAALGALAVLMVACLLAGIVGVTLARRAGEGDSAVPFGPFLTMGLVVLVAIGGSAIVT